MNKHKLLLTVVLASVFFFLSAQSTNAAVWGVGLVLAAPLIIWLINASILLTISPIVISISGRLINWSISSQNFFLNQDLVLGIWEIVRNFMNLFFILVLLVIAFATIFNKPTEYTAKQLLPKLIIAALLINFSLVIGLWVIDIFWTPAQIFLKPFERTIVENGQAIQQYVISEKLADTLEIKQIFKTEWTDELLRLMGTLALETLRGGVPTQTLSEISRISGITSGTVNTLLLIYEAFIMGWIALMLWIRVPILIGLLIVSPIAWLGFTVPAIKKETWNKWWNILICWAAIPLIIFGLLYFVILFKSQLTALVASLGGQAENAFLKRPVPYIGLETGGFMVWLITIGILLGGLTYVKGLSCSLYGWAEKGFKGTWKGIGKTVDFGYTAFGWKGAVGKVEKEFQEGGIPIFGARRFGVAQREAREARTEKRLRTWAGLGPSFIDQENVLDNAEKGAKDVENRIKNAKNEDELREIITELRRTAAKGKADPETLAAITTLAKRGEMDIDLFNQAVKNFKDMPLALSKVMNDWKEGKFGGITVKQFIEKMKDERGELPLDARRIMYSFAASEDGKPITRDKEFEYKDFETGVNIVGQNTRAGRDYMKFWGDTDPLYVAKYRFDNKTEPLKSGYTEEDLQKIKTLQDAIREQIKKASVKNIGDYFPKTWDGSEEIEGIKMGERFEGALAAILREKQNRGTANQFVSELRRKLRREGKDKQLEILDGVVRDIGLEVPEVVYQGEQTQ